MPRSLRLCARHSAATDKARTPVLRSADLSALLDWMVRNTHQDGHVVDASGSGAPLLVNLGKQLDTSMAAALVPRPGCASRRTG